MPIDCEASRNLTKRALADAQPRNLRRSHLLFAHPASQENIMNSIIYIVGLVVVVGIVLSFIGIHL